MTEVVLNPDRDCVVCKGSGHMSFKGRRAICECIIRKKVKEYLGSLYADIPYAMDLNFDDNKATYFESSLLGKFKSLVKSFLIYHKLKLKHMSVFPQDIIQYYVTDGDEAKSKLSDLTEIDFLVIFFIKDPPNKLYGEIIESILEKRLIYNKITWLYCKDDCKESWFTERYSLDLSNYIVGNFNRFKELNRVVFERGVKKKK
jgi:hypothetical protein